MLQRDFDHCRPWVLWTIVKLGPRPFVLVAIAERGTGRCLVFGENGPKASLRLIIPIELDIAGARLAYLRDELLFIHRLFGAALYVAALLVEFENRLTAANSNFICETH